MIEDDDLDAKYLVKADLEARQNSFAARKTLLRTNPSLYVSQIRLSVRQIPLYANDSLLKRIGLHALKSFEAEVKAGSRKSLTSEETAADDLPDENGKPLKAVQKAIVRNGKVIPLSRVSQAKILRQDDKVDPTSGLGKSKGYGFLEFHKHSDALKALRWINANPDVDTLLSKWHAETMQVLITKLESNKSKTERDESRLERLKSKMAELQSPTTSKRDIKASRVSRTVIVEFSVE